MSLDVRLPEFYRYRVSELRGQRVLVGVSVVTLFCLTALVAVNKTVDDPAATFAAVLLIAQALVLALYGSVCLASSVSTERSGRTWDFQRMTPQGSLALTLGKFFGAPIYAWVLWAAFVPWQVMAFARLTSEQRGDFAATFGVVLAITFLAMAVATLTSALMDRKVGMSDGRAFFAVFLIATVVGPAISSLVTQRHTEKPELWTYYGLQLTAFTFVAGSAGAFGLWALAAARWRIGVDLLESPRLWRLPLFVAFLVAYIYGFADKMGDNSTRLDWFVTFLPAAAIVYMAALYSHEGLDQWKSWLRLYRGAERWHRTPLWIVGWLTIAVLGAALFVTEQEEAVRRAFLTVPAFMLRDFCIFQLCRLSRSRSPGVFGVILVALAYAVPGVLIGTMTQNAEALYLALPTSLPEIGTLQNVLPGVLQAMAAVVTVVVVLGKRLSEQARPS